MPVVNIERKSTTERVTANNKVETKDKKVQPVLRHFYVAEWYL